MKVLTCRKLKEMDACRCGLRKFRELFGDEMKVTLTNLRKLAVWGTTGGRLSLGGKCSITRLADISESDASFFYWYAVEMEMGSDSFAELEIRHQGGNITRAEYIDRASRLMLKLLREEE